MATYGPYTYSLRHLTICCLLLSSSFVLLHLRFANYKLSKPRYVDSTQQEGPNDANMKELITQYETILKSREKLVKESELALAGSEDVLQTEERKQKEERESKTDQSDAREEIAQIRAPPVQNPPVPQQVKRPKSSVKVSRVKNEVKPTQIPRLEDAIKKPEGALKERKRKKEETPVNNLPIQEGVKKRKGSLKVNNANNKGKSGKLLPVKKGLKKNDSSTKKPKVKKGKPLKTPQIRQNVKTRDGNQRRVNKDGKQKESVFKTARLPDKRSYGIEPEYPE